MEASKSTKTVRKKNTSGQLLSLLAFLSVIPLYGLYFHLPNTPQNLAVYANFQQDFDAASRLSQAALYAESNEALWALLYEAIGEKEKLMVLELIRRNSRKSDRPRELLKTLYIIQAYDPEEVQLKFQKELFDTLKKIGKDKDASLYLQAKSGLNKKPVNSGSAQLVIASIGKEEVYQAELDQFVQENPQFESKKSEGLIQLIIRRILKRKSLGLLEESDFQQQVENLAQEIRIKEFLKRELSTQEPTEMELRAYYEANKNDYNHPAGVRLAHLLLFDKDKQALRQIEKNPPESQKDFEVLVAQFSRSLNKVRGGVLPDWVISDDLPTEGNFNGVWDFLQKRSVGFHGPFKSRRGTHYFWIFDQRGASYNEYDKVLDQLKLKYASERSKQIQEQYFKRLIIDQQVQIFHERM